MTLYTMLNGVVFPVLAGTLEIDDEAQDSSVVSLTIQDPLGSLRAPNMYPQGTQAEIGVDGGAVLFAGVLDRVTSSSLNAAGYLEHAISLVDNHYYARKRHQTKAYENISAGDIMRDLVDTILFQEGVTYTVASIDDGPTILRVKYDDVNCDDIARQLADRCGYFYLIDVDKVLYFKPLSTNIGPAFTGAEKGTAGRVKVVYGNSKYRNWQILKGVWDETSERVEEFKGDGKARSWPLGYKVAHEPSIETSVNPDLIVNGDCEAAIPTLDGSQWGQYCTAALDTAQFHAGATSVKLTGNSPTSLYFFHGLGANAVGDMNGFIAGETYHVEMWERVPSGQNWRMDTCRITININNWGTVYYGNSITAYDTWQISALDFTMPVTATRAYLMLLFQLNPGYNVNGLYVYYDDVMTKRVLRVGIKGVESGKEFYWNKGEATIYQDDDGTALTSSDTLTVTYIGMYPVKIVSADTTKIASLKLVEGGSGIVENVESTSGIETADAGLQYASQLLAYYGVDATRVIFTTQEEGYEVGQLLPVDLDQFDIDDSFFIQKVSKRERDGILEYTVEAVDGPLEGGWERQFLRLSQQNKISIEMGGGEILIIPIVISEAASAAESVSVTVYACPLCGYTTYVGSALHVC